MIKKKSNTVGKIQSPLIAKDANGKKWINKDKEKSKDSDKNDWSHSENQSSKSTSKVTSSDEDVEVKDQAKPPQSTKIVKEK